MAGRCKASVVLDIQHAHTHNALLCATSAARALAAVFWNEEIREGWGPAGVARSRAWEKKETCARCRRHGCRDVERRRRRGEEEEEGTDRSNNYPYISEEQ